MTGYASRWLRPERMLALCLIPVGVVLAGMANVPLVAVSMAGAILIGVLAVGWLASQQTLIQTNVEDRYLGRAFGEFNTTNAVTLLLGTVVAGALADLVGIVPLLNSSAILYSCAGLLALFLLIREKGHGTARHKP